MTDKNTQKIAAPVDRKTQSSGTIPANLRHADVVIVGGGPAGLAAAVRLYDKGVKDILILERESKLGGILRQCIHDGFGLTRFGVLA